MRSWNQTQKYKGRVVLRSDSVGDDSGSYAVFTEKGSAASQMTAAKLMDVIARLPGCAGQVADAVSAETQVKSGGRFNILKLPQSECPDIHAAADTSLEGEGQVWGGSYLLLLPN